MKKLYFILTIALVFCLSEVFGQPVSIELAQKIATNHMLSMGLEKKLKSAGLQPKIQFTLKQIVVERQDTLFYVLNDSINKGFVIVSADKRAWPILVYSDEGVYDATNLSPGFRNMLEQQRQEIEYLKQNNIPPGYATSEKWKQLQSSNVYSVAEIASVSPMIQSKWDQGCYYNANCPYDALSIYCQRSPTGCTATATCMLMKFWSWPLKGKGSHSYYSNYGLLSANFGNTNYNWAAMPNSVTSQNTEVANLMAQVGISLEMQYGTKASGAWNPSVLVDFFGYSSSQKSAFRSAYSSSDWSNLLKNELDNGRPILYRGDNGVEGHAFICDGYNGSEFHFNWGWSGTPNSYFYLSNLNPNNYNFNYNQEAVIGIQPQKNGADLIIAAGTQKATPTTITAGNDITVSCAVDNQGNSSAGSSYVTVWIGSSVLNTSTAIYLGKISFSSLAANSCSIVKSATLKIPTSTPAGKFFLWFWADGEQSVNESVEDNNFASVQVTITSGSSNDNCPTKLDHTSASHNPNSFSTGSGDDIIVTTNPYCKIALTNSVSWISASATSSTANNVGQVFVNYTLLENSTQSDRVGTFYINGVSFSVTQKGCTYDFYPVSKSVTASGSTYDLDIDSYGPCQWSFVNIPSWIHLSQTNGSGDPRIMVTVDANPNCTERKAELRLSPGNSIHIVTQLGSGNAPIITKQPTNQTVTASASAIFSISATGSGLSYQWQVKTTESDWNNTGDGGSLSGSNTANLTIKQTSVSINGCQFRCKISNSCSTVTSNEATLYVTSTCIDPLITSQPTNQAVKVGEAAKFRLTASGSQNLYQWQMFLNNNWINIIGASYSGINSSELVINNVTQSQNGLLLRCQVSCSCSNLVIYTEQRNLTVISTSLCTAPLSPKSFTLSIGNPVNGLDHRIITKIEDDLSSEAEGYSLDYSWDGINWESNYTQSTLKEINWSLVDQPNLKIYWRARSYKCEPKLYSDYIYPEPRSISTACDEPAIPTISGVTSNSLQITLNAEVPVENSSNTTYSVYCSTTNQYVQKDGSMGVLEFFYQKAQWGTKTITGLSAGKSYSFYAKAKNDDGDIRYNPLNLATAITQNATKLTAPTAKEATEVTSSSFIANWTTVAGANNVIIDVALDAAFTSFVPGFQSKDIGNVTSLKVSGLSPNVNAYYRLIAYSSDGKKSDYSNVISLRTLGSTNNATLTIGTIAGSNGQTISVPVTGTGLAGIAAFQFTVEFDPEKIEYKGTTNWVCDSKEVIIYQPFPNKITFVYSDLTFAILNGKFFDLLFFVKTSEGTALVKWSDTPTIKEFGTANGEIFKINYTDGAIGINKGTIQGKLVYSNASQTPISDSQVFFKSSTGQYSATSDVNGLFTVGLENYMYDITVAINGKWDVSAMDITVYQKALAGMNSLTEFQKLAGDVNQDGRFSVSDLIFIKKRIVGEIDKFSCSDFITDPSSFSPGQSGENIFKVLERGDANLSWAQIKLKSASSNFVATPDNVRHRDGLYHLPFTINKTVQDLSSVTLKIEIPAELSLVSVLGFPEANNLTWNVTTTNEANILYSTLKPYEIKRDEILCTLVFKEKNGLKIPNLLNLNGKSEFGNFADRVISDIILSYPSILGGITNIEEWEEQIKIFPNPAKDFVTITNLQNGDKIEILDIQGRPKMSADATSNLIEVNVNKLLPGTYIVKLIKKNNEFIFRKLIIK